MCQTRQEIQGALLQLLGRPGFRECFLDLSWAQASMLREQMHQTKIGEGLCDFAPIQPGGRPVVPWNTYTDCAQPGIPKPAAEPDADSAVLLHA
jgi:hypothetical protein